MKSLKKDSQHEPNSCGCSIVPKSEPSANVLTYVHMFSEQVDQLPFDHDRDCSAIPRQEL